jgi:hypothetical protein
MLRRAECHELGYTVSCCERLPREHSWEAEVIKVLHIYVIREFEAQYFVHMLRRYCADSLPHSPEYAREF